MNVRQVMKELKALGNPQTVKIYRNHGADGEMFGVKIGDLKRVLKQIKGDQELALQLWETNNSDAMYLAALAADGSQMTRRQLDDWAKTAWWYMLSEYAVPSVAAEHPSGVAAARKWMRSRKEHVAASGWSTYSSVMSIRPDEELDLGEVRDLLYDVAQKIHDAPNRVRYCMNNFVIASGAFVKPVFSDAKKVAKQIGKVSVDVGNTSCKVPLALQELTKIKSMGRVGKKRRSSKC